MKYPIVAATIFAVFGFSIAPGEPKTPASARPPLAPRLDLDKVSMIRLLSDPLGYHESRVIVRGVLNIEFEGTAIFLDESHSKFVNTENALWLALPPSGEASFESLKLHHGKWVSVDAVFNADSHGHFGLFAGSLKVANVRRLRGRGD